jgi:hypothetical protein
MRIITLNANGIRSAGNKGVFGWIAKQEPDVVCVQETKAQEDQLSDALYRPKGYHCYYFDALKKGYSGVAIYAKRKPDNVTIGYGSKEFDAEGRYLEAQFGRLSVVSVYLPSGSSGEDRQRAKFRFLGEFMPHLRAQAPRLHPVRRLEHRPQGDRPAQLALEPEELRLPAAGARLARPAVRRRGLCRRLSRDQREARPIHVVVEPRPGLGEQRRLAHRLPDSQPGAARQRAGREHL